MEPTTQLIIYWALTSVAFIGVIICIVPQALAAVRGTGLNELDRETPRKSSGLSRWIFLLVVAAFLTISVWPAIQYPERINPDEELVLAQAQKALIDPLPWRSFDPTTAGPLNTYVMSVANLFGIPLSFGLARIVSLVLHIGLIAFTYGTARTLYSELTARLAVLPMVLIFGFGSFEIFDYYHSEALSCFLVALGTFLLVRYLHRAKAASGTRRGIGLVTLYLTGLVLGAMPYAKLQSAPIGIAVAALAFFALLRQRKELGNAPIITFVLGGITVAILISVPVLLKGYWPEFVAAYLSQTSFYSELTVAQKVIDLAEANPYKWSYVGVCVLLGSALCSRKLFPARQWGRLTLIVGYLLVCIFVIYLPGTGYDHYYSFLFHPTALLLAELVGRSQLAVRGTTRWSNHQLARIALLGVIFALICAPILLHCRGHIKHPHILQNSSESETFLAEKEAVVYLREQAAPGDQSSVWGWNSMIYVDSGLPMATRDSSTHYASPNGHLDPERKSLARFQERYLTDFKESKPRFFVDAAWPGSFSLIDRDLHGHEVFDELRDLIRAEYTLSREFGKQPDSLRVYIRK